MGSLTSFREAQKPAVVTKRAGAEDGKRQGKGRRHGHHRIVMRANCLQKGIAKVPAAPLSSRLSLAKARENAGENRELTCC